MKYVLLSIFVFIASLPVQASVCDMNMTESASHNQHQDMSGHAGMDMDMDCCDSEPTGLSGACDPLNHCGASASASVTIDSPASGVAYIQPESHFLSLSSQTLDRHEPPPLRPPIA